tara:strand:- start:53 stop:223 length:171 start_codon:yes stop_codon:yes gene_type:complete
MTKRVEFENESSLNLYLDLVIAEHLDITVDEVDRMDLCVVKELRELFENKINMEIK